MQQCYTIVAFGYTTTIVYMWVLFMTNMKITIGKNQSEILSNMVKAARKDEVPITADMIVNMVLSKVFRDWDKEYANKTMPRDGFDN